MNFEEAKEKATKIAQRLLEYVAARQDQKVRKGKLRKLNKQLSKFIEQTQENPELNALEKYKLLEKLNAVIDNYIPNSSVLEILVENQQNLQDRLKSLKKEAEQLMTLKDLKAYFSCCFYLMDDYISSTYNQVALTLNELNRLLTDFSEMIPTNRVLSTPEKQEILAQLKRMTLLTASEINSEIDTINRQKLNYAVEALNTLEAAVFPDEPRTGELSETIEKIESLKTTLRRIHLELNADCNEICDDLSRDPSAKTSAIDELENAYEKVIESLEVELPEVLEACLEKEVTKGKSILAKARKKAARIIPEHLRDFLSTDRSTEDHSKRPRAHSDTPQKARHKKARNPWSI